MTNKNEKLYEDLVYFCWLRWGSDDCILLLKTREEYEKFLIEAKYHFGDCTKDSISCLRCILHRCEIEAQQLYNYLDLDSYVRF
jgi:hypothetical protein